MINGSFPIVAHNTMDYCSHRLLAVNTYNLQQHHSNSCSQLLFRSEFQKNFDAVCFSDQNSDGRIISTLYFSPFFVGNADIRILQEFRLEEQHDLFIIIHFVHLRFVESVQTLNMLSEFLFYTENY